MSPSSPWWVCRWCGNPWRDDPALVRQAVHKSLAMYRDHLRACIPYRTRYPKPPLSMEV